MHPYVQNTEYAVRGIFNLIGDEESRCAEVRSQLALMHEDRTYTQSILHIGAPPTGFGEDSTPNFERRARVARRKIRELEASEFALEALIEAKAFSVRTLAGAILQVAKQGIIVGCGSLSACPPGRQVGNETLKNVIWQGRNQAMHWEEHTFKPAVTQCFLSLEHSFGAQFHLGGSTAASLAKELIDLLQWSNYHAYERDMQALLC